MGNFKNIFKRLRISAGLTQVEMAEKLKISRSTIGMYETGAREPDFETLEKIADFFNVDIDYLLGRTDKITLLPETAGRNYHNSKAVLNRKDERDIEKILDQTRDQLLNQEGLMFDGDPASPEAIESILSAMKIGMELAKEKNKKYTPKKFKKD